MKIRMLRAVGSFAKDTIQDIEPVLGARWCNALMATRELKEPKPEVLVTADPDVEVLGRPPAKSRFLRQARDRAAHAPNRK